MVKTDSSQLRNLRQIAREWRVPVFSARPPKRFGHVRGEIGCSPDTDWRELTNPNTRGWFHACRLAVQTADREALDKWRAALEKWKAQANTAGQGKSGDPRGGDSFLDRTAAQGFWDAFLVHLRCAQIACIARSAGESPDAKLIEKLVRAAASLPGVSATAQTVQEKARKFANTHWTETADKRKSADEAFAAELVDKAFGFLVSSPHAAGEFRCGFLRDLIHELLGIERPSHGNLAVAFALVNLGTEKKGDAFLAEFVMDRLPDGTGEVFPAPAHAFLPRMDADFGRIFEKDEVPFAVRNLLAKDTEGPKLNPSEWDVRVRLRWLDDQRLIDIPDRLDGNSATGAAARGLWHLLSHNGISGNKVPDPEVVVLAAVNAAGELEPVNGLQAKARAVVEARRFDTIVVANDRQKKELEGVLKAEIEKGGMRVVVPRDEVGT